MDRKTGGLCLRSSDLEQQTHQQNDLKQIPDFAESRFIHTFVKLKVIDVVRLVLFSVTGLRICRSAGFLFPENQWFQVLIVILS